MLCLIPRKLLPARYTVCPQICKKRSAPTRRHLQNGMAWRRWHVTNGSAGRFLSRKKRHETSMFKGQSARSRRALAGLVVGLAVFIARIRLLVLQYNIFSADKASPNKDSSLTHALIGWFCDWLIEDYFADIYSTPLFTLSCRAVTRYPCGMHSIRPSLPATEQFLLLRRIMCHTHVHTACFQLLQHLD